MGSNFKLSAVRNCQPIRIALLFLVLAFMVAGLTGCLGGTSDCPYCDEGSLGFGFLPAQAHDSQPYDEQCLEGRYIDIPD